MEKLIEEHKMNEQENVRTFIYPNAIVRVYFADISDEENERRMKRIENAAIALLKEREERMRKNEAHKEVRYAKT